MDRTAVLIEVLDYLKEKRVPNSLAYSTMGLSDAQGKTRKSGQYDITNPELCRLAEAYPAILPILETHGINCGENLDRDLFRENALREIDKLEEEFALRLKRIRDKLK